MSTRYRDRIISHEALKKMCELLKWANASDADDSDRPPIFASQRSVYGRIWDAVMIIVNVEAGIEFGAIGDVNWGGNESWYEDLMVAVDNASYTFTMWKRDGNHDS